LFAVSAEQVQFSCEVQCSSNSSSLDDVFLMFIPTLLVLFSQVMFFHIFHIFIFTMIDRSTRWPAIVPISSITAESCIQAFTSTWVARFSVPDTLTSDRGSQFISSIWTGVCRELGITVSRTTSYHPQANGMIERFHRSLKVFLRA